MQQENSGEHLMRMETFFCFTKGIKNNLSARLTILSEMQLLCRKLIIVNFGLLLQMVGQQRKPCKSSLPLHVKQNCNYTRGAWAGGTSTYLYSYELT